MARQGLFVCGLTLVLAGFYWYGKVAVDIQHVVIATSWLLGLVLLGFSSLHRVGQSEYLVVREDGATTVFTRSGWVGVSPTATIERVKVPQPQ